MVAVKGTTVSALTVVASLAAAAAAAAVVVVVVAMVPVVVTVVVVVVSVYVLLDDAMGKRHKTQLEGADPTQIMHGKHSH